MNQISKDLQDWYHHNKRDLPWRNTNNPYLIWISEIILQQTRVDQGLDYFHRFIERFPDIKRLALAPQDEVLKYWQGLGYYSRARNLHQTAIFIQEQLDGKFPNSYSEIIKLKGIGPYTAAAIASFAFNEAKAAVDGNVYRVLARLFSIDAPIDTGKGQKLFQTLAQEIMDPNQPAIHNQAMMELGSQICSPKQAQCNRCPLEPHCQTAHKNWNDFPVKKNKTKVQDLHLHHLIIQHQDQFAVEQRPQNGIWAGLYQFPNLEGKTQSTIESLLKQKQPASLSNLHWEALPALNKHLLSHRTIYAHAFRTNISDKPKDLPEHWQWVNRTELKKLPVSRLMEKLLNYVL